MFPLRNTTFEGVPVMIPFKYQEMLESEYGEEALTKQKFKGWVKRFARFPERWPWSNFVCLGTCLTKRICNGSSDRRLRRCTSSTHGLAAIVDVRMEDFWAQNGQGGTG